MNRYGVIIELTDEMKNIEKEIVDILPQDRDKAMAIMLHLCSVMKERFGVKDEVIIEKQEENNEI